MKMKAVFAFVLLPSVLLLPSLIDASGNEVAEIQIAESRAIIDAPNWQVDGKILWADNCDFMSQDLFSTDNVNRDDCRKMCFDNPKCSHFTWYIGWPNWKTNFCFQKKGNWAGNKPNALADAQCGHLPERSWISDGWTVDYTNLHWTDDCNLLSVTPNTNKADCRKLCLNSPRCNHFTWLLGDNTNYKNLCILKQGQWPGKTNDFLDKAQCGKIPGRSLTTDGWTVDGDVTWKINCDFDRQDIQGITNPTPNINQEDCGKLCFDNPKCDHFTWYIGDNTNKNLCYLKSGVWTENRPNDLPNARCGFISVRPWKQDGDVMWDDNCSFDGQDIANTPNTKKEDCSKKCWANPQCDHFTWTAVDSTCYLKTKSTKRPTVKAEARCGYVPVVEVWEVDGNFFWDPNCEFPGQNLQAAFTTDSLKDCGNSCYDNSECDYFNWKSSDKKCHLKTKGSLNGVRANILPNAQCGYIPRRPWKVDANNVKWDDKCDFYSPILIPVTPINPIPNTRKEDCGKLCFQNPQCSHFTWWVGDSNTNKDLCILRQGYWPGNSPSDHATALCGYIPGRSAWTLNKDKPGTPIWGNNCDFPGTDNAYHYQVNGEYWNDKNIYKIEDCATKCYETSNLPCTHFITSGNECKLKSSKARFFSGFTGPYYEANAKCGYLKDRL